MTKVSLDGRTLKIELRLQPTVSKTGKSMVIASTRGQINTGIEYRGSDILVVANAYILRAGSSAEESGGGRKLQNDTRSDKESH